MDAIESRVAARMKVEGAALKAEQMKLGKSRQTAAKDAKRALAAMEKVVAKLAAGTDVPTAAEYKAATAAFKDAPRSVKSMLRIMEQMAANTAALTALDDPAEATRRVEAARDLGVTDEPVTGVQAAEMVLIRRGKATHISDLTDDVLESGIVKLSGKTPQQTMSAYCAKEAAKADGRFVRVAPGVFDLRNRVATAA